MSGSAAATQSQVPAQSTTDAKAPTTVVTHTTTVTATTGTAAAPTTTVTDTATVTTPAAGAAPAAATTTPTAQPTEAWWYWLGALPWRIVKWVFTQLYNGAAYVLNLPARAASGLSNYFFPPNPTAPSTANTPGQTSNATSTATGTPTTPATDANANAPTATATPAAPQPGFFARVWNSLPDLRIGYALSSLYNLLFTPSTPNTATPPAAGTPAAPTTAAESAAAAAASAAAPTPGAAQAPDLVVVPSAPNAGTIAANDATSPTVKSVTAETAAAQGAVKAAQAEAKLAADAAQAAQAMVKTVQDTAAVVEAKGVQVALDVQVSADKVYKALIEKAHALDQVATVEAHSIAAALRTRADAVKRELQAGTHVVVQDVAAFVRAVESDAVTAGVRVRNAAADLVGAPSSPAQTVTTVPRQATPSDFAGTGEGTLPGFANVRASTPPLAAASVAQQQQQQQLAQQPAQQPARPGIF